MLPDASPDAYEQPKPGDPEPDLVVVEPGPESVATDAGMRRVSP